MSGLYIQRDLKYQGKSANLMDSDEPLKVLEPEDKLRAEGKKEWSEQCQGRWEKMLLHSVPCYRAPVKKKKGINKAEEVRIEERECKAYFGDRIYVS